VPSAPAQQPQADEDALRRLSDALAENERLRRRVADAEETAVARSKEVTSLRTALRRTQANLDAFRKGAAVNDSGFKELRRMMTTRDPEGNGTR
jgi:hypothetical protein